MGLVIDPSQSVAGWWECFDHEGRCRFCGVTIPGSGNAIYAVDAVWYQPQVLHAKSHGVG